MSGRKDQDDMAIKTISKNGKRVPANEKGREAKKGKPSAETGETTTEAEAAPSPTAPAQHSEITPIVRVRVPTDIGKLCAAEQSRYAMESVAVLADHGNDDRVLLAATDGRAMAIVMADRERIGNVEGAGLTAAWMPKSMARAETDLRLAKGYEGTLFGDGLKWVDDDEGRFAEVPDGGQFPPFLEVLPDENGDCTLVSLNPKLLATLTAAVNDPDGKETAVLLIPKTTKGGAVSQCIRIVGNRGIGVLMPQQVDAEARRAAWASTLRAIRRGRPSPRRINLEGIMPDAPAPDAAQQMPSSATPEPEIDTDTGEVLDGTSGNLEMCRGAPDDGKDAPSSKWSDKLLISVGVLPFVGKWADTLRAHEMPTLNEVRSFLRDNGGDYSKLPVPLAIANKLVEEIETRTSEPIIAPTTSDSAA